MLKSEKDCIKQIRKRTGAPIWQCRELAVRFDYDLDRVLEHIDNPAPFVGQLFSDKYVHLSYWNLSVTAGGTPVTQQVLDDPNIQASIKSGLLRLTQPYIVEDEEFSWEKDIPFYSKEETEDYPQELKCPHCDKGFYCRGFGAYAGAG